MLVVAQFPIADVRPFLPSSAKRSRPVKWPPKADIPRQFVHAFGPATVRQRGIDWAWVDERVYCRADRALRFPHLPIGSEGWQKNLRCAFRRLLTDCEAVARVEVGLSWIPEDEETLLWRYWDKAIEQNTDPTQRLEDANFDVNPLDVVRSVAAIPTNIHPMVSADARKSDQRELMLRGRSLAELYWRATASKKSSGTSNGTVVQGAPVVLIECRSHWIARLPRNFIRVNSASAAGVNLAFGRIQTSFGALGVWVLGHQQALASQIRNLRLCLLRLHAEQEVLDIILGKLSDGVIEYRAADPSAGRIEE